MKILIKKNGKFWNVWIGHGNQFFRMDYDSASKKEAGWYKDMLSECFDRAFGTEWRQNYDPDNFVNPTGKQIGGDHYKKMKIQPIDFITDNNIGFLEGNIIKYVCRHKDKNGIQDLEKAKHYIEILIQKQKK